MWAEVEWQQMRSRGRPGQLTQARRPQQKGGVLADGPWKPMMVLDTLWMRSVWLLCGRQMWKQETTQEAAEGQFSL